MSCLVAPWDGSIVHFWPIYSYRYVAVSPVLAQSLPCVFVQCFWPSCCKSFRPIFLCPVIWPSCVYLFWSCCVLFDLSSCGCVVSLWSQSYVGQVWCSVLVWPWGRIPLVWSMQICANLSPRHCMSHEDREFLPDLPWPVQCFVSSLSQQIGLSCACLC